MLSQKKNTLGRPWYKLRLMNIFIACFVERINYSKPLLNSPGNFQRLKRKITFHYVTS